MSYHCEDGQGQGFFKVLKICNIEACEKECTKYQECQGFDFAKTVCEDDTCRLYQTNAIEEGNNGRKFCERTEGKSKEYPNTVSIMNCFKNIVSTIKRL